MVRCSFHVLSSRSCILSLLAMLMLSGAPPAFGRNLTSGETRALRAALLDARSIRVRKSGNITQAADCMVGRLGSALGPAEYVWTLKYYRNELTQRQIDQDPYNLLDWLSDNAAACLKTARGTVPVRVRLAAPSVEERRVVEAVKGASFVRESGAFPAKLLVSKIDLGTGGNAGHGMAVVQMGSCSNHACTFLLLSRADPGWIEVASFDSWGAPYLVDGKRPGMKDVIYFDHVTDDCMACSPPKPVRLSWNDARRRYIKAGVLPDVEARRFKLTMIGQ